MVPPCLDKQMASMELPHDWLVRVSMNLATVTLWSSKQPELTPFGYFNFFPGVTHRSLATPTPHHLTLYACGIVYLMKKVSKMVGNQLTIH